MLSWILHDYFDLNTSNVRRVMEDKNSVKTSFCISNNVA